MSNYDPNPMLAQDHWLRYLQQAFKKLKSHLFFDKSLVHLRERIVQFEGEYLSGQGLFDSKLGDIADSLAYGPEAQWDDYVQSLVRSIKALPFPKSVVEERAKLETSRQQATEEHEPKLISNRIHARPIVDKLQFYIDMNIEGILLGMLWVTLVGVELDKTFGDCSYGYRIRTRVREQGACTFAPSIFEPYFSQYERWRDGALDKAEQAHGDKVDVAILSLDFKSFFYTIDFREDDLSRMLEEVFPETDGQPGSLAFVRRRLTEFVFSVIEKYSDVAGLVAKDKSSLVGENILPIGFPPSPILANWCMNRFDKAVNENVNPLFYGRYVDDIMVVVKVEGNSFIRAKWEDGSLEADTIFDQVFSEARPAIFKKGGRANGVIQTGAADTHDELSDVQGEPPSEAELKEDAANDPADAETGGLGNVFVGKSYLNAPKSRICLQRKKVKVFYFDKDAPIALIKQFRKEIAINSSEFRLMPDIASLDLADSYSVVFDLQGGDSPNKFREVDEIRLNSFELSKFLGCCERVAPGINDKSKKFDDFTRGVLGLFEPTDLVGRYTTWEKLFETAVSFGDWETIVVAVEAIANAVCRTRIANGLGDAITDRYCKSRKADDELRRALLRHMRACLHRALSLVWGKRVEQLLKRCEDAIERSVTKNWPNVLESNEPAGNDGLRELYCRTYMLDKYAMPVLPQYVLPALLERIEGEGDINLTDLDDVAGLLPVLDSKTDEVAIQAGVTSYYPYVVKKQDLEYAEYTRCLFSPESASIDLAEADSLASNAYSRLNLFNSSGSDAEELKADEELIVVPISSPLENGRKCYMVDIPTEHPIKEGLRVGICNMKLADSLIDNVLQEKPDRSFRRYKELVDLTKYAHRQHVDVLVLPEASVPYAWIPKLTAFSARNNMAIICGVEHVLGGMPHGHGRREVRNLTAVILPYQQDSYQFSKLTLHEKTHMAPAEMRKVENYGFKMREGDSYELYHWRDVWFPVYCCFELASIRDRALFAAYADVVFAVEWNRDTAYFSNIAGSLARDLSCCFVQVNNSAYGDSRITLPTNSRDMDIVKVKGAENTTILIGEVDVKKLRTSQLKVDGDPYKPPAPDFDRGIVRKKLAGNLAADLREVFKKDGADRANGGV